MLVEFSGQVCEVSYNIAGTVVYMSFSVCCIMLAARFSAYMISLIKKDIDKAMKRANKNGY